MRKHVFSFLKKISKYHNSDFLLLAHSFRGHSVLGPAFVTILSFNIVVAYFVQNTENVCHFTNLGGDIQKPIFEFDAISLTIFHPK